MMATDVFAVTMTAVHRHTQRRWTNIEPPLSIGGTIRSFPGARMAADEASARLRCHRCHRTLGVRLADGSWEMLSDSATVVHDGVQRTVCQRCALGVSA